MTIEEKLKEIILSRYHSVREFAVRADIPYTTLLSIFSRGIGNSSVNNVIKICKALHISADGLANGVIESRPVVKEANASADVQEIVDSIKTQLTYTEHLYINGHQIEIESVEPIINALDIGCAMVEQKTTNKNTNKNHNKIITKTDPS